MAHDGNWVDLREIFWHGERRRGYGDSRRAATRARVLMEACESRILLSTISVLGNGIQITSGATTVSTANGTKFGANDINHLTITETFTITDPDPTTALNLTGSNPVSISGNNASDFTVSAQPGEDTIDANGGQTTFTISFLANDLGDRNATVNIASDDTSSPFTFAVQGYGSPAIDVGSSTPAASVAIRPGNTPSLANFTNFGYTAVNNPSFVLTRTFVIENSGSDTVGLTGAPTVAISGADAADFTVSSQPATTTLGDSSETAFTITFAPRAGDTGLLGAVVTIDNDGTTSPFRFNIAGTSLATTPAATGFSTQIAQLAAGSGSASQTGEYLVVNYTGLLLDGTKFDSSLNTGRSPFTFILGPDANQGGNDDVITGWEEGMLNLKAGEQRVLLVPASEAYGASGSPGSIPPNADLIFTVERLQQLEVFDAVSNAYIPSNSAPTTANHTDFGKVAPNSSPITMQFDLTVPGQPPNITSVSSAGFVFSVTGPSASEFTASALQQTSGSNFVTVTFTPGSTAGLQQATINLPYFAVNAQGVSTPEEYSFNVQATLVPVVVETSSTGPSTYGQNITLTATVSGSPGTAPTGTVTFFTGGTTSLGTGTLISSDPTDGSAVWTLQTSVLSAGAHNLTVQYSGDSNYRSSKSAGLVQTVNKATLAVTGITAADKLYNGGTAATVSTGAAALVGILPADSGKVALVKSGAAGFFASPNVAAGITVTITGLSLSGTAAGNYTIIPPTAAAAITIRHLAVSGITADNKAYDGTNAATLVTAGAALLNVAAADAGKVSLVTSGATGTFPSANIGAGQTVTISGLTLAGPSASNYALAQPTVIANIHRLALTVTGITANNKPFDGTTAATLNTSSTTLSGVLIADSSNVHLSTSDAVGTFSSAAAGNAKTVTITGLVLTGSAIGNYSITPPTTTANITPNALPIGSVGAINASVVSGWAIDQDTPGTALTVQVNIDGTSAGTVTANIARPDLVPIFGTANHGFSFAMPTLSVGIHRVDVYALDTSTSAPKLLASQEIDTNVNPIGSFAAFNGSLVKGWAFDANAGSSSIEVRYQIDGNAPELTTASVTQSDLTATLGSPDHGFAITLPQLTAGTHTVSVWAVDSTSDAVVLLATRTATVSDPPVNALPKGSAAAASTTLVKGWAYDPTAPSTSINVRVDIDGVAGTPFTANLSCPDLVAAIGSANHGFSQSLSLSAGAHRIDVYALDSTSSTPVLLSSQIVGDAVPIGSLGTIAGGVAKGWAFDSGLAGLPATVRLDVDGLTDAPTIANTTRPDLAALLGGPDFGFQISLPTLVAGTHTAKLWVIDPLTLAETLLGSQTFVTA